MRFKLFLTSILFFAGLFTEASPLALLQIDDGSKFFDPSPYASGFVDKSGRLDLSDILKEEQQKRFIPIQRGNTNFGFIPGAVWLKFRIKNQLDNSLWLEIKNSDLDNIEYFLVNNSGDLLHHHVTGKLKKLGDREIKSGRFFFNLYTGRSDEVTVYLKVMSATSSITLPLRIAPLQKFYESGLREWVWLGMYFGFTIFLVIYNIFLTFSLKDRTYLYFALFIAMLGLLFAIFKGVGIELLWKNYPGFNGLTTIIASLSGVFMIFFTARFLQTGEKYPIIHRWLLAMAGLFVIIIGIDIAGFEYLSHRLLVYNAMTGMIFLILVAAKAWKDGYKPARYYLLAWSFYMAGMFVHLARDYAFLGLNVFVANVLQISSTISILLMSFALSKKINIYITKRNEAQELALRTARENERLISDQNQLLEARVRERTIDLEQSIDTLRKQRKELK